MCGVCLLIVNLWYSEFVFDGGIIVVTVDDGDGDGGGCCCGAE